MISAPTLYPKPNTARIPLMTAPCTKDTAVLMAVVMKVKLTIMLMLQLMVQEYQFQLYMVEETKLK